MSNFGLSALNFDNLTKISGSCSTSKKKPKKVQMKKASAEPKYTKAENAQLLQQRANQFRFLNNAFMGGGALTLGGGLLLGKRGHGKTGWTLGALGTLAGLAGLSNTRIPPILDKYKGYMEGQKLTDTDWQNIMLNNPSGSTLMYIHPNYRKDVIKNLEKAQKQLNLEYSPKSNVKTGAEDPRKEEVLKNLRAEAVYSKLKNKILVGAGATGVLSGLAAGLKGKHKTGLLLAALGAGSGLKGLYDWPHPYIYSKYEDAISGRPVTDNDWQRMSMQDPSLSTLKKVPLEYRKDIINNLSEAHTDVNKFLAKTYAKAMENDAQEYAMRLKHVQ